MPATMSSEAREIDDELRGDGWGVLLCRADVAKILDVTPRTVRRYEDAGRLSACRFDGGHPRFRRRHVAEFLSGER